MSVEETSVVTGKANIVKALKNNQTCWMSSSKQSTSNDHLLVGSDLSLA